MSGGESLTSEGKALQLAQFRQQQEQILDRGQMLDKYNNYVKNNQHHHLTRKEIVLGKQHGNLYNIKYKIGQYEKRRPKQNERQKKMNEEKPAAPGQPQEEDTSSSDDSSFALAGKGLFS